MRVYLLRLFLNYILNIFYQSREIFKILSDVALFLPIPSIPLHSVVDASQSLP